MSWTKRQFIEQALDYIGLASHTFDITPEELQSALNQLDTMMASWYARGLSLYYPLPSTPSSSSLDDLTSVPDMANEAIYTNLALRLAPAYGKPVTPEAKQFASMSYQTVVLNSSRPMPMQFPSTLPRGSGNKPIRYDREFMDRPDESLETGNDQTIDYN